MHALEDVANDAVNAYSRLKNTVCMQQEAFIGIAVGVSAVILILLITLCCTCCGWCCCRRGRQNTQVVVTLPGQGTALGNVNPFPPANGYSRLPPTNDGPQSFQY